MYVRCTTSSNPPYSHEYAATTISKKKTKKKQITKYNNMAFVYAHYIVGHNIHVHVHTCRVQLHCTNRHSHAQTGIGQHSIHSHCVFNRHTCILSKEALTDQSEQRSNVHLHLGLAQNNS